MLFTDRVLDLINKSGTTKNKLLSDIGLNHNSFGDWIKKNQIPNGETIAKIAKYFNVSTDYLLGISNNPNPPDANKEHSSSLEQSALESINELAKIGLINLEEDLPPQIEAIIKFLKPNKDFILELKEKSK